MSTTDNTPSAPAPAPTGHTAAAWGCHSLAELIRTLEDCKTACDDPHTVYLEPPVRVYLVEKTLSDGSTVSDLRIDSILPQESRHA